MAIIRLGVPADLPAASDVYRSASLSNGGDRDNLLVLYFDDLIKIEQLVTRLATIGHSPVEAQNPYWTENGAVTIEDPDHWRVVLMPPPLA